MTSNSRSGSKPLRSKVKSEKDIEEEVEALPQLSWRIINETTTKQLESANVNDVAKETKFSNEQTSAFITILHILLDNINTKHLSLGENVKELQDMMCGVGCAKVQSCLECYTTDTSVSTLLYVQTSIFQHYRLYQYIFTEGQEMEVVTTNLTVEVPNTDNSLVVFPLPLEESISQHLYLCFLVPQLAQPPEPIIKTEEVKDGLDVCVAESGEEVAEQEELEVSADDIKSMMEAMVATSLQCYQPKMLQMMKEQDNVLDAKLSKLEKKFPCI